MSEYTRKAVAGGFFPDSAYVPSRSAPSERLNRPKVSIRVRPAPRLPRLPPVLNRLPTDEELDRMWGKS